MNTGDTTRDLLEYACEHCGAGVGERCFTTSGHPAAYPHASRYWLWREQADTAPVVWPPVAP